MARGRGDRGRLPGTTQPAQPPGSDAQRVQHRRCTGAAVQPLVDREQPVARVGDEQRVFVVAGDRALALCEDRLDYRSLGTAVKPARGANFKQVLRLLIEHCPAVPCDHRLERPHTRAQILGPIAGLDRGLELAAAIVADDVRRAARDPYR